MNLSVMLGVIIHRRNLVGFIFSRTLSKQIQFSPERSSLEACSVFIWQDDLSLRKDIFIGSWISRFSSGQTAFSMAAILVQSAHAGHSKM